MAVTVPAFAKYYNISKFAIIYDEKDAVSKSDGTVVLPEAIENNGYEIINKNEPITFKTGDTDFSAIVTKLKGMNPEAIAFGGLYQEGLNFAKELKRQGLHLPVIGTVGLFSMALLEEGGEDVEGWVVPSFFNTFSKDPRVTQFIVRFEPEAVKYTPNSTLPDAFNASAYDTMHIIAKSLTDKGLNGNSPLDELRQAIREGWEGLKDYNGITGNTNILENGDADKQVYVLKIEDGEYKEIPY
jgi:branched-chain amino acid transport system substrate-binding protein